MKVKKDFQKWHEKKTHIENNRPRVFFKEREIWLCYVGENIGFEQDGRGDEFLRPVIIIKKFNNEVLWAVSLTKIEKKNKYYFSFTLNEKVSVAILSQIRLIDAKRLKYKIGDMKIADFKELKNKIRQLLA